MEQPLAGYRVIDLGQIYNGPYCTLLIALLGAEVIKVEPLQGEIVRQGDPVSRMPYPYVTLNAKKKSVTLNLKHPQGKVIGCPLKLLYARRRFTGRRDADAGQLASIMKRSIHPYWGTALQNSINGIPKAPFEFLADRGF
ncbi:MAG: CoA transferase, partial [bacterium]|nr:CoA transferase [bacterium]